MLVILSEVEGSAVVLEFAHLDSARRMGAPGLDFQTWDATTLNLSMFVSPHYPTKI
jgi:hypothetical protein